MKHSQKKAIWTPGWYAMDQSISVRMERNFWFFRDKSQAGVFDEAIDLVFFNQLDSTGTGHLRFAHVVDIYHQVLGSLARIDTAGLDYLFVATSGRDLLVNAEEESGKCNNPDFDIHDWSVSVTLAGVSEPFSEID